MEIHIFGNSFSYGIEIDREALSLSDLRDHYKEKGGPHVDAWPNLISPDFKISNHSVASSGFLANVSRAIVQSRLHFASSTCQNSIFLIDASLHQHLFLEDEGKSKAPVFFEKKYQIQRNYHRSLNPDVVHFQIWNAAQLLRQCSIQFYFFFSYNPYWFGSVAEFFFFSEMEYEKYAVDFCENRQMVSDVGLPEQIAPFFLDTRPLISYVESQYISKYGHIKSKDAHRRVADVVFKQLQEKSNDFVANY
jgi:hypothetical protein